MPLGMEDYRIPSGALRSGNHDSYYNSNGDRARLNDYPRNGFTGGWYTPHRNHHQWLQIGMSIVQFRVISTPLYNLTKDAFVQD